MCICFFATARGVKPRIARFDCVAIACTRRSRSATSCSSGSTVRSRSSWASSTVTSRRNSGRRFAVASPSLIWIWSFCTDACLVASCACAGDAYRYQKAPTPARATAATAASCVCQGSLSSSSFSAMSLLPLLLTLGLFLGLGQAVQRGAHLEANQLGAGRLALGRRRGFGAAIHDFDRLLQHRVRP